MQSQKPNDWRRKCGDRGIFVVPSQEEFRIMGLIRKTLFGSLAAVAAATLISAPAIAQQKPNIVVIMGDDICGTSVPTTAA
jgi:hypothetical protein